MEAVAAFLEEETADTSETWLAELEALGEPPRGQDAWGDVLARAVETIVRLSTRRRSRWLLPLEE